VIDYATVVSVNVVEFVTQFSYMA